MIGTSKSGNRYLHARNGNFGETQDGELIRFVEGVYDGHSIEQDEFNGKTRDMIVMKMSDGEESYLIDWTMGTCGSWMLASYMGEVSLGDRIRVEVKPGSDNPKVTVVFVKKVIDGKVGQNVPRIDMGPDKHARAEEVFRAHPGYGTEPVPADAGETTANRDEYDPFADE